MKHPKVLIYIISTLVFMTLNTYWSIDSANWKGIANPCLCQEFRCENGSACLHKSKVCSSIADCPNGEDEFKESCQIIANTGQSCKKDEFKCKFGGCIKLEQVCDKIPDCWGGVDEASDFCEWVNA